MAQRPLPSRVFGDVVEHEDCGALVGEHSWEFSVDVGDLGVAVWVGALLCEEVGDAVDDDEGAFVGDVAEVGEVVGGVGGVGVDVAESFPDAVGGGAEGFEAVGGARFVGFEVDVGGCAAFLDGFVAGVDSDP